MNGGGQQSSLGEYAGMGVVGDNGYNTLIFRNFLNKPS
jgi:hypothetical protein